MLVTILSWKPSDDHGPVKVIKAGAGESLHLRSAARRSILSPTPCGARRSATSGSGSASRAATRASSRNGWRASRPTSAMMRSSRPRLRRHNRPTSNASSADRPSHPCHSPDALSRTHKTKLISTFFYSVMGRLRLQLMYMSSLPLGRELYVIVHLT